MNPLRLLCARMCGVMVTGDPNSWMVGDGAKAPDVARAGDGHDHEDHQVALSNYVMDAQQAARQKQVADEAEHKSVNPIAVAGMFAHSLAYSALQNPVDGVTQLVDGVLRPVTGGRDVIPRVEFIPTPRQVEFGGAEWTAKLAGGGIGTILPFWLGGKAAVGMMGGLKDVSYIGPAIQKLGILEENSVAQLAFKGAVYEGIFHPVDENAGGLWSQRAVNGTSGALSFLALGYVNKGLRMSAPGKWMLNNEMRAIPLTGELLIDATSGATAGITDTLIHGITGSTSLSWQNLAQSAGEYGLMSIFLKLGRMPVEKAAGEKAPVAAEKEPAVPRDAESLRDRLPYDKSSLEHIGKVGKKNVNVFYREIPEGLGKEPIRMSAEEYKTAGYHQIEHKGQKFAIDEQGNAYSVTVNELGFVELVPSPKIILDRLGEVQVPWPPIQNEDQFRSRQVIRLDDLLFGGQTAGAH